MGQKGIFRRGAEVEKKRAAGFEEAVDFGGPVLTPADELGAVRVVLISAVAEANVVGRGGDNEIDTLVGHGPHAGEAVFEMKVDHGKDH